MRKKAAPKSDGVSTPSPHEKFSQLAKKLFAVRKSEVDALEKKWKSRK